MININFNQLDNFISVKKDENIIETETTKDGEGNVITVVEKTYPPINEFNPVRYEFATRMIDQVLEYLNDVDPALGVDNAIDKAPITIQTYYDTLIDNGIITE